MKLLDRWGALNRRDRDWLVVVSVTLIVAATLGGLTTHEDVGWRQMVGFALAIAFFALFALGLSLEFGHTGLLNLGHVAFMAIGAYTYGILMMSAGRPDNAAPVVGWLYDQTPSFVGSTPWGVAVCLLWAFVAAALALIPLLLVLASVARKPAAQERWPRRLAIGAAVGLAGAGAAWLALQAAPGGKSGFVAGLLLFVVFAGWLAALVGGLVAARALLGLAVAWTPLGRSGNARMALAGIVASLVGIAAFVASFPLDENGARAMGVLIAILLGMSIAALVAFLLGLPAIRLREDYLAIVTLGFAEILRSVIVNEAEWTRGTQPIQQFPRPIATWVSQNDWWRELASQSGARPGDLALLVVYALVLAYAYVVLRALTDSPWGRVLRAIREDEEATQALGKPVWWFKLQSLMLGSAIAAVAGVLFVSEKALVAPLQFLPIVTFYAFIIIVLGGLGNHRGALVGAVILWGIFFGAQNAGLEAFGVEAGPAQLVVVGVVLIVVMMFRPQGLVGRKEELLFVK